MSDQPFTFSPLPPQPDPVVESLIAAGIYQRVGPDRCRMSEAGLRWYLAWLPEVIAVLAARSRTPPMEQLIELERQTLDLRVQIEELKRGIVSPHRAAQARDEEA